MKRYLAILFTAVLVAGCGGGGGSAQRPITAPPPETFQALNENALLLISDAYIHTRDPRGQTLDLVINSSCSVSGCTISNQMMGLSQRVTVHDLFDSTDDITDDVSLTRAGTRNGLPVYRSSMSTRVGDEDYDFEGLGVWMTHSAFMSFVGDITSDGTYLEIGMGMLVGNRTGSFPAFSATYRGAMLGVNRSGPRRGDQVQGDARIDFNLPSPSDPRVSIAFTDISGASTGSLRWDNLAVASDGTFLHGNINGSFFGPNHEEVGGTFSTRDLVGAYGGKR